MENRTLGNEFEIRLLKKELNEMLGMLSNTDKFKSFAERYRETDKGLRLIDQPFTTPKSI